MTCFMEYELKNIQVHLMNLLFLTVVIVNVITVVIVRFITVVIVRVINCYLWS